MLYCLQQHHINLPPCDYVLLARGVLIVHVAICLMELDLCPVSPLSIGGLNASRCQVLMPCTVHEKELHMLPFPMLICLCCLSLLDYLDMGEFLKLEPGAQSHRYPYIEVFGKRDPLHHCITSDLKRDPCIRQTLPYFRDA